MNKLIIIFGLILSLKGFCNADELRPQFRVWKSSFLGSTAIFNTLIASSPIIFHTVLGSPTVNNAGSSYLAILRVTDSDSVSVTATTRAFVPLDIGITTVAAVNVNNRPGIGDVYNVKITSKSFVTKQGGAVIQYLWDWYSEHPNFIHEQDDN